MRQLTLKSFAIDEQLEQARQHAVEVLRLSSEEGFHETSISFVRQLPSIRKLEIISRSKLDISPLIDLPQLRCLSLNFNTNFDLARLPKLESFSGHWSDALNLRGCFGLRSVALDNFAGSVADFRAAKELQILSLVRPTLNSFEGLTNQKLLALRVHQLKQALSFRGIGGAPHLVELSVSHSKAVTDLDELSALVDLYELRLNGIKTPLDSLKFIEQVSCLQGFRFVGTRVISGDLSPLKRLKWVGFDNRKHYSLTEVKLDEILRPKGGGAVVVSGDFHKGEMDIAERRSMVAARLGIVLADDFSADGV